MGRAVGGVCQCSSQGSMQWDWAGLYDVCQCSSQGSMQYMSSCLRSVYLFVFGYFVQRRESMCGFLIVFGCLKFYFAETCNGIGQGCMMSVSVQVRDSCSPHMYSCNLACQPVLSLCLDERQLQNIVSRATMSSLAVNKPCWLPLHTREVRRQ